MEWLHYIFGPLLFLTSFFLIVVILLQRGKGGGLVGALGGSGGQSAFGTKFGDRLMWVTYGVAVFWMLLILLAILLLSKPTDVFSGVESKKASNGVVGEDPLGGVESKEKAAEEKPADEKPADEKTAEQPADKTKEAAKPADETASETAKPEDKPAEKPEGTSPASETKPETPAKPAEGTEPKQ